MLRIKNFIFTIIQSLLLTEITRQSHVKQATTTLKTIGKTIKSPLFKQVGNTIKKPIFKIIGNSIKNSVSVFRRNKNTIKNVAAGIQGKYLRTCNNFGNKSIKYLTEEGIKKFKYTTPQMARGGKQQLKTEGKNTIYMRSAAQMRGKGFGSMLRRSAGQMDGKELRSLINMVSKSKPQLPFLFAAGGLNRLTQMNVKETWEEPENQAEFEKMWENDTEDPGIDFDREGAPEPKGTEKVLWQWRKYTRDEYAKNPDNWPAPKMDFSLFTKETNKLKKCTITITYDNTAEGQRNLDDVKKLFNHFYPVATFVLIKEPWPSLNFRINVNGNNTDVYDYLNYEGKDFRGMIKQLMRRIKNEVEICECGSTRKIN